MCLPGYRGACQGGARILDRLHIPVARFQRLAEAFVVAVIAKHEAALQARAIRAVLQARGDIVSRAIGYRGAQPGQGLVRFVHEQRHGVFTAMQADPLIEPRDDGFRASVAVLLDHDVDVFIAQLVCRGGGVLIGH
ncbi:hypothetical protein D3C87_1423250 [compost metagenome]